MLPLHVAPYLSHKDVSAAILAASDFAGSHSPWVSLPAASTQKQPYVVSEKTAFFRPPETHALRAISTTEELSTKNTRFKLSFSVRSLIHMFVCGKVFNAACFCKSAYVDSVNAQYLTSSLSNADLLRFVDTLYESCSIMRCRVSISIDACFLRLRKNEDVSNAADAHPTRIMASSSLLSAYSQLR